MLVNEIVTAHFMLQKCKITTEGLRIHRSMHFTLIMLVTLQMLGENLLLCQNYCKVTKQHKIIMGTFCHWCHPQFIKELRVSKFSWVRYCFGWSYHEEWDWWGMQHICMHTCFGGETWGEELHGRPRCRWEVNIKMELKGMDWSDADRILWRWYWT